jgi:3-oxoacyl-[acyl-carrier protein] reductase
VITSSITGPRVAFPGQSAYAASKAGVNALIRTAALEFAKYNITINGVEPGSITTEGFEEIITPHKLTEIELSIPLGKFGEPEDVAHAMAFLASDEAKYITGQTIIVDGGQTLPESRLAMDFTR